jgi:ABC-2 type transport system permease protein
LRSPEARLSASAQFMTLLAKELRELAVSRAYWILLLIIGPLAGHAFITAVKTYAEASGIGGGPAALAQGLSPLDGIFVPAFGAYDIAVTLLFPFVAIRLISAERESGAWKLMLQMPAGIGTMLSAKAAALLTAWAIAWIPGFLSIALWKIYGGSLFAPEILNLLLGHFLRVILSAGVAVASASIAASASSAAIATLGFTIGTWALEFVAEGRGGWLHTLASFTPTAALRVFEQGELQLSTALVMLTVAIAGFCLAAIWLSERDPVSTRLRLTLLLAAVAAGVVAVESLPKAAWDLSENRRNSFSESEETALRQIREPLRVTVNLAAEDPRWMDLNRNVLSKLERVLPHLTIDHVARSRSGLFEGEHYGEVWYEIGGRRVMSRSATEAIVLENLFKLAGVGVPAQEESRFAGHPLAAQPTGAPIVYYLLWPVVVAFLALLNFRK